MKKFNLLMLLLLLATGISAQTFDLGEGRKATLDQAGNYRLAWNQKSQNGGSVSGTFSGKLKDGKRDGIWKGSFTYQLFSSNDGLFKSGAINFTRTYSNGIPNGAYSYNSTLKVCNGSFDYLSKQWKYGKFENFAEQITGSFKNGHADGKWYAYQQQPFEKITMQFEGGKAVGTWTITEKVSQTLGFKNGYLVQQKETRSDGWGTELSYTPDEKLEELPNQDTVKVSNFLAYGDYYMKGAGFDKWWRLYPENSSNEDYTAYYILADYDNHLSLWGNVPDYQREIFENGKKSREKDAADKKWGNIPDSCAIYISEAQHDFWYDAVPDFVEYYYCSLLDEKYPELKNYEFGYGSQYKNNGGVQEYKKILNRDVNVLNSKWEQFMNELRKQLDDYNMTDEEKTKYLIPQNITKETIFEDGTFSNAKLHYKVNIEKLKDRMNTPVSTELTEEDIAYFICQYLYYDPQTNVCSESNRTSELYSVTKEQIQQWVSENTTSGKTYKNIKKTFEKSSYYETVTLKDIYDKSYNKKWFTKIRNKLNL